MALIERTSEERLDIIKANESCGVRMSMRGEGMTERE